MASNAVVSGDNWQGLLHAIKEEGYSAGQLPFYIVMGTSGPLTDALAKAFLPISFYSGNSMPGAPAFFAARDAAIASVPLSGNGARGVFIPPGKWIRNRPDDPLNGVVWCLSATEIAAGGIPLEQSLTSLWQATLTLRRKMGVGFPLYIVVTGDDGLQGFSDFAADVPAKIRDESIVGWVHDDGDDWRATGNINTSQMEEWLAAWRTTRLHPEENIPTEKRDAAYLLPRRSGTILRRIAAAILEAGPSEEEAVGVELQGVFLVLLPVPAKNSASTADLETLAESFEPAPPDCEAFALGLFRGKILPERWLLTTSVERARRSSAWKNRLAMVTALLLLLALATHWLIFQGLNRVADGPLRVLNETEHYRRWLWSGAAGEPPAVVGVRPPPPVFVGGNAPPFLPELPFLYKDGMELYLPELLRPGWVWRRLFRIDSINQAAAARAASALGAKTAVALAGEQIAEPLRICLARSGADVSYDDDRQLSPEEFNFRHPPDSLPVNWRRFDSTDRNSDPELFSDQEEWESSCRELLRWLRRRLHSLGSMGTVADFPDRFVAKRLLDSVIKADELSEQAYQPWIHDSELEHFLQQCQPNAATLQKAMLDWNRSRSGGWQEEELSRVARWLEQPPAYGSPAIWLEEWLKALETWRERPDSPLIETAHAIWQRAVFADIASLLDRMPRSRQGIKDATDRFAFAPAPLPRIPLSALSSASYDPVWRFRPEIWRADTFVHSLSIICDEPNWLEDLVQANLLGESEAQGLQQLRVEPMRRTLLSHARSYADYWINDIAMLANPAHWLIGDPADMDMVWLEDASEEADLSQMIVGQRWADFHAAMGMIDARDLTRRLLLDLTRRRIEALGALAEILPGLEDSASLSSRIEYALIALTEDEKLYATPEYWNAAATTFRSWRSLGRNADAALERMGKNLSRSDSQSVWENFFPVLAANFFIPETGEPVRLQYWRGFVQAALNLIQAETQRKRWRSQRTLLLRVNSFPWRRDAPRLPGRTTAREIRTLLGEVGVVQTDDDSDNHELPELPGDSEIQASLRGLFAGLGWTSDWLPPANRRLDSALNRLLVALGKLEEWEALGGVPLVILPQRMQADSRHRYLRAFALHQGSGSAARSFGTPPGWDMPYEASQARWAWMNRDQLQMRLGGKGSVTFDFYNQTVPVAAARIGQARIGDESWPILSLLLTEAAQAQPYSDAMVESDEAVTIWRARLPVRGVSGSGTIWWDFGFALPAAFGPETPGSTTLLSEWPTAGEWQTAVEEWNAFVGNDPELRIPLAADTWKIISGSDEEWAEYPASPVEAVECLPDEFIPEKRRGLFRRR